MKIVELVSMHLLVLSAFRRKTRRKRVLSLRSQCTFWCLVLSDSAKSAAGWRPGSCVSMHLLVLSAFRPTGTNYSHAIWEVSMHLLVLSAFRRNIDD